MLPNTAAPPPPCAMCHFGSPHTAARSRVCHGSLCGLPLLLTSSPDSAMCHFQVSLHCWWVPFCDRVLYGLPLLLPPPPPCAMCLCRLLTLLTAFAF
ncbi:unnamed protein product [Staurois parvus]|uniref:Uncharacterized protein n=1 Tax=Staurois parvus TaxID=386267 RepID=A0ABN9DF10_9NEOB|nr:unnamed protein product [Staurois parvus]